MLDYEKFLRFSEECNDHYRALLEFEYKKMELITEDDIENLSKALPEEQALVMKSNSLETKRAKLLGSENAGKTFRELADSAPDEYKKRLKELYQELCSLISRIKELNDTAAVIINSRLKRISTKTDVDTYNGNGGVSKTNTYETHTTFKA